MLWYIVQDVPGQSLVQKIEFLIYDLKLDPWRIIKISLVYGFALAIPYVGGCGMATVIMSLAGLTGIVSVYITTCLVLSLDYFLGRHFPIIAGIFDRHVGRILKKHYLIQGERVPTFFELMELFFQRDKTGRKIQALLNRLPFKFTLNEQNIVLLILVLPPIDMILGADAGIAILCGEQSRLSYRTFLKVVCYHLIPFALFSYAIHLYAYSDAKLAAAIFVLSGLALLLLYVYFPDRLRLSNDNQIIGLKRAAALAGGLGLGVTSFVLAIDSVQTLPPLTYMLAAGSWVMASIMAFWINGSNSGTSNIIADHRTGYALVESTLPGFILAVLVGDLAGYPYRAFLDCLALFLPLMVALGSPGIFSETIAGYNNGSDSNSKSFDIEIADSKVRAWRTFIGLVAFCILLFSISHKVYDGQVLAASLLVVACMQMMGRRTGEKSQPTGWSGSFPPAITMVHFIAGCFLTGFFWWVDPTATPATPLEAGSLLANPLIIGGTILSMAATFFFSARSRPHAMLGMNLPHWSTQEAKE